MNLPRTGRRLLLPLLCAAWAAVQAQPSVPAQGALARGEYLSRIGGCAGCHTADGGAPFAGGRPLRLPLGTIYSTNITPDPVRGIGGYSREDFSRALREGTAPGGKHLYPAMPYTAYVKLKDEDVSDLYDYLRQRVAPVVSAPPPNDIPFPMNQRWGLWFWKLLFMPGAAMRPAADAQLARGAYLVQSVAHCGSCHTPRGVGYQERGYDESAKKFLTGEVNDHWFASNLTGDPGAGLGRLDRATVASFLKTGRADGLVAFGSMAEEVQQSLRHLDDADALAIATYVKALPAREAAGAYAPSAATERLPPEGNYTRNVESAGAAVYRGFCRQCHQADGRGVGEIFPRLAGNPALLSEEPDSLVRIVLEGGHGPPAASALPAAQHMPAFKGTLSDVQIAQVLTYTREAWGNYAKPVTASDVARLRKQLKK